MKKHLLKNQKNLKLATKLTPHNTKLNSHIRIKFFKSFTHKVAISSAVILSSFLFAHKAQANCLSPDPFEIGLGQQANQTSTLTNSGGACTLSVFQVDANYYLNVSNGNAFLNTNLSTITSFINNGTIKGTNIAILNGGTINTLNNSGRIISTAENGSAIINDITINTLINSGLINGGNGGSGIDNESGGVITSLTNSGAIFGVGIGSGTGINNAGTISNLYNYEFIYGVSTLGSGTGINNAESGFIKYLNNYGTIIGGSLAPSTDINTGINNAGTIENLNNYGTIIGGYLAPSTPINTGINNAESGTISNLNNYGTIYGISTLGSGIGINNAGTISNLNNYGTIYGVKGDLGTGINTGINNAGTISNLNNLQGAANSPLIYTGKLPTNYYVIIQDKSHYGQLLVSNVTGNMTFGISQLSTGVSNGLYTGVLQGFSTLSNVAGAVQAGTTPSSSPYLLLQEKESTTWDLAVGIEGLYDFYKITDKQVIINQLTAAIYASNFALIQHIFYDPLTGQDLINALNSITAEPYADNQTVGLQFLRRQSDLLLSSAGDNCQDAKKNYCGFVLGGKNVGSINGQNGLASFNSAVVNTIYGVEWNPNKKWSLGIAYGYGTTNLSNYTLDLVNIKGNVNSGIIYGVYRPTNQWKISALFNYSGFSDQGSRLININNDLYSPSIASSNFAATGYSGVIKATYDISLATKSSPAYLHIIPVAEIAFNSINQNNFSETGAGVFNLAVNAKTTQSLTATIGVTMALPIPINQHGGTLTPSLTASYNADFLAGNTNNYSINTSFSSFPNTGSVNYLGQNGGTNFLNLTATVAVNVSSDVNLYVIGNYEASNVGSSYSYSGGVKMKF